MQIRTDFDGTDQGLAAAGRSYQRPSKKQVKCHHDEMGAA
ncbi:hypothetical protein HK44_002110 [Pseudomonas fluorescens HK44]|uniref:Uncharacterized protein n=1 Tax=Pseudomonas fluorescens HK44 TaxID=1042209 RepID=A0A010SN50_PSEFL|nr:hypothetical protein HK44_002110 [Pseudomonas fluorescens HK44]